jgi:cytoplasmic iron level regulating protein YaaA (DUF328/UPF0246 family)
MLILLPPSEGKAAAPEGPPLDLSSLSFPALTRTRQRVLNTLVRVSGQRNGRALLGLPPGLASQVERNTLLREAPAQPAALVYTGVLYEALGLTRLSPDALERASRSLLIFSGLFGVLQPDDRIPAYRLSMDVAFPRMGPLAAIWRTALTPLLEAAAGDGPIVDCRSSTYAAAWKPSRERAGSTLQVRVLQETDGVRTVVSHMAKKTRGEVARALLEHDGDARTVEDVLAALRPWFAIEAREPARAGAPWLLDVVVPT